MIDKILQNRLAPVALRHQQLYLRQKLMISWLAAALLGLILLLANMLGRWSVTLPAVLLSCATVAITVYFYLKSREQRPDYKAIALYIEQHQPDLKALLLTAVEQKPLTRAQQLNYLQERVIDQAVQHAQQNNWLKVISNRKLEWANYGRWATGILFVFIAAQLFPPISFVASDDVASADNVYRLLVNPGNAEIEQGSPVVITARFEGKVPSDATLVLSAGPEESEQILMTKNMDDPVYGAIVPQVDRNLTYRIEYDNLRSEDFLLSVYSFPELLRADAHIIYPDYADLEDKTVNDTRQISVLEGSRINFTFQLNKPVVGAQLTARDGSVLELTVDPDDSESYLLHVEPRESQRYDLQLIDAEERTNKVPPRITIIVQKNMPPEIKPTFPNRDLEPSPLEELAFEAQVWDDYGVTDYGLNYTVAGRESQTVAFDPQTEENKKKILSHILALEELDVAPDQLLTWYYWAHDVGPDNRQRVTASDLFFAEIRPFEEIFQESQSRPDQQQQEQQQNQDENQPPDQQQQQQNTQEMIKLQKEIINATWNVKRSFDLEHQTETFTENVATILESQAEVQTMVQEALGGAEDPESAQALQRAASFVESALEELARAHDADAAAPLMTALGAEQAAYQEFLTLRAREFQVGRQNSPNQQQQQQSQQSTSQRTQRQLDQLEMQQRQDRYETERQATLNNDRQANQQEDLQVQNRLSDLARRQNDIRERLQQLQSELQAAEEEQQEEIQRELRRLQEDQQEMLRDMDELQQQMNEPQNQQRMSDANQQLGQTREDVQQAAEQMQQGELSRAITSATRAQNELEQIRDELREQTSNQFSEQMRQMRAQAQELDRNQQQIGEQIGEQIDPQQRSLTDSDELQQLIEQLRQQRQSLEEILQQMRDVSEQSEETEPILSRRLYDTLRQPVNNEIGRDLEVLEELLRQRFLPQAQEIQQQTGEDITELRQDIENAAESVLGSEADALRQARRQLDELIRQLEAEANQAQGSQPTDQQQQQQQRDTSPQSANQQQGAPGEAGDPNQMGQQQQRGQQQQGQQRGQRQGQQQQGQQQRGQQRQRQQRGRQQNQAGRGDRNQRRLLTDPLNRDLNIEQLLNEYNNLGGHPNGPITGEDYLDWARRLRDVQEMLEDPELRGELDRIGELVRQMRNDVTRHGDEPQWDQVQNQVIKPMVELYHRLGEDLALLESADALVPIDRDPVPRRFIDLVRNYYETLGKGKEEIKDKEEIK